MFEDFKKQVKTYNDRPNKTLKLTKLSPKEDIEKLKQIDIASDNATLEQLLSECLDSEGLFIFCVELSESSGFDSK